MAKILVVDDSEDSRESIRLAVGSAHECIMRSNSIDIEAEVERNRPDLILLDVNLPERDGFQTLAILRETNARGIPTLFISARSDTASKVLGLSLGAEDYIAKPFDHLELKARVESKLEKFQKLVAEQSLFLRGELKFNLLSQKIFVTDEQQSDRQIDLTPHEFKLLLHLARHEERVFNREQLLNAAWGHDIHVSDRMIDTHISNLRKKLGGLSTYIETVIGVGYRFDSQRTRKKAA